jgi:hypothetical protein
MDKETTLHLCFYLLYVFYKYDFYIVYLFGDTSLGNKIPLRFITLRILFSYLLYGKIEFLLNIK